MSRNVESDQRYHNLNVTANAIELVAQSIRHLSSDDMRKSVNGEALTSDVLHEAIASRLQRRVKSHQYTRPQ